MTATLPNASPFLFEIADPRFAALFMASQPTIRYAPGDGKMYRLSLVQADPDSADQVLLITLNINSPHPQHYVLRGPRSGVSWDRWTAGRWQAAGLPEEIYPAIVAVLGALGWADHEPLYSSDSLREFDN